MKMKCGQKAYNSVRDELTCESQLMLDIERPIHGDVQSSVNLRKDSTIQGSL